MLYDCTLDFVLEKDLLVMAEKILAVNEILQHHQ